MLVRVLSSKKGAVVAAIIVIAVIIILQSDGKNEGSYRLPKGTVEALRLSKSGHKEKAFIQYMKQAREGERFAQFAVGAMFDHGQGVEKDLDQAIHWYERAAEDGQSSAQYNVAKIYLNEKKYRDVDAAIYWLRRSAKTGDPGAKNQLGLIYERGVGVKKDNFQAWEYFRDAAKSGSIHGVVNAARLTAEVDAEWASPWRRYKWLTILDSLKESEMASEEMDALGEAIHWTDATRGSTAAHWWLFWNADRFGE